MIRLFRLLALVLRISVPSSKTIASTSEATKESSTTTEHPVSLSSEYSCQPVACEVVVPLDSQARQLLLDERLYRVFFVSLLTPHRAALPVEQRRTEQLQLQFAAFCSSVWHQARHSNGKDAR